MNTLLRNIPNVLTAVRVLLAPLTAYLIMRGNDFVALGVFAAAGATDAVDGFLARRFGLVSRFGEYLDPAADKLLMLICFVTLTMMHQAPLWLSVIVIGRLAVYVVAFSRNSKTRWLVASSVCPATGTSQYSDFGRHSSR